MATTSFPLLLPHHKLTLDLCTEPMRDEANATAQNNKCNAVNTMCWIATQSNACDQPMNEPIEMD